MAAVHCGERHFRKQPQLADFFIDGTGFSLMGTGRSGSALKGRSLTDCRRRTRGWSSSHSVGVSENIHGQACAAKREQGVDNETLDLRCRYFHRRLHREN